MAQIPTDFFAFSCFRVCSELCLLPVSQAR